MKTINLRGITESLSEKEMKLVKGGGQPLNFAIADDGATVSTITGHTCDASKRTCSITSQDDSTGKSKTENFDISLCCKLWSECC